MKFVFPALALALAAGVASPALAQVAAPPGSPSVRGAPAMAPPNDDRRDAMQQMRERMRQVRMQARTQMLDALSPAHRSAFGAIVGQLAIAPTPDVLAAEVQIDALLSPTEKQAIFAAEASGRSQFGDASRRPAEAPAPDAPAPDAPAPDAARLLLRATLMGMGGLEMRAPEMRARS